MKKKKRTNWRPFVLMAPPAGTTSSHAPPKDNHLVQELRKQVQELQRMNEEQICINTKVQQRLQAQDQMICQKKDLQMKDLQKQLQQITEQNTTNVEFSPELRRQHKEEMREMISAGRKKVNDYMEPLLQDNTHFKDFSSKQQAIVISQMVQMKEMKKLLLYAKQTIDEQRLALDGMTKTIEKVKKEKRSLYSCLINSVETAKSQETFLEEHLNSASKTIKEQDIILDERQMKIEKLEEEKMALSIQLQEAIENAERREILLTTTTNNNLQQEQKEKQALQKKLSTLEQMFSEEQNKAQELGKNLKAEPANIQSLTTDTATLKKTFEAVIEKCSTAHNSLVEENKTYLYKIVELTVALHNTFEEGISVLLRREELVTSQKESEEQLQAKIKVEELQVPVESKRRTMKNTICGLIEDLTLWAHSFTRGNLELPTSYHLRDVLRPGTLHQ